MYPARSNDEVERRGAALPPDEADLFLSSMLPLGPQNRYPTTLELLLGGMDI
jgi:hypothetical protein